MSYDLVIVGMGSGGMIAAQFAASLDLTVAVVERARVGGDCLWTGCVPSKALIASGKAAHRARHADRFGVITGDVSVDLPAVWRRIRSVQHEIATTDDDPDSYRALGLEIVYGQAEVTGPDEVTVDGSRKLATRFVLLATGSRPAVPDIAGLHQVGFLTSETLWDLTDPPRSLVFIGGGPIAIELAQACRRLDIAVTVLQRHPSILRRDEPILVASLTDRLRSEGVEIVTSAEVTRVDAACDAKRVTATVDGEERSWTAAEIVVATGRQPNLEGLGLEALGIETSERGIKLDERGRTNLRSVYAAGDVAGRTYFTHSAGYEGVRAVRDMFFPGKGNVTDLIPWCTFTDPELAHAGLTIAEAEDRYGDEVDVWRLDLTHSDRARADGETDGSIIVITSKGKLVGAHILAPNAGEMIHELALAISQGMKLADISALVHIYPTLSTSIGQLAAESAFEKAQKLRWLMKRK